MTFAHDLVHHESPSLVGIAALLCTAGAWATSRFFRRMTDVLGGQRYAWLLLTSLASAMTIWCTHFVAMLGYDAGGATSFAWAPTAGSLVIAMAGSAAAFMVAAATGSRGAGGRPALGGVLLGLSIAAMHYTGMTAMRMHAAMSWNLPLVALSIVFGVLPAALGVQAARSGLRRASDLMWGMFVVSVLLLHFTGMAAMHHDRTQMDASAMQAAADSRSQYVLAVAIAAMSFVTLGAGVVGYLIDNHSRAAALERFRRLAMYDVLTDLPNRTSLNERLDREIDRSRRRESRLGLIVIDVDNFKEINDLRGHPVGDEVLRVLGARMGELTRGDDGVFIARMGGDEFVALCRLEAGGSLLNFMQGLRSVLSTVINVPGGPIVPRASLGAAVYPDDAEDAESLVRNADLAMYRAKSDPLHDMCEYDAAVDERTRLRRGLTADLREALGRGEFFLHYQVQSAVPTGEAKGYEALLRWQHRDLGLVSPAEFIPLAEDSGLIISIGEWVLRTACAEAARWRPAYRVAVNVSALQLTDPGFVDTVRAALADSGLRPDRLELEMTETAVFSDREHALRTLREIKQLGVAVALDDYGVGYSSLDVLRSFPFDRIKIDRSFLSGSGSPEQTVELIQMVLSLGRTFGMSVLAEGIETDDQLALLSEAGCQEAQGFLFGRPTAPDEIARIGQLSRG
jgi:diguanylate cyclase (GGDEF)-like protein